MKRKILNAAVLALVLCILVDSCNLSKKSGIVSGGDSSPESSACVDSTDYYDSLQEETCPHTSGTFIQSYQCDGWNDERWEKELSHYQKIGIQYIILGDTAVANSSGNWNAFYPSKIKGMESGDSSDMFDVALRNCQKHGMKVFIGMGLNTDFWDNILNFDWMKPVMEKCNDICTELYSRYYAKYSDTFYGWYWPYEIANNVYFGKIADRENNIKKLVDSMNICLDHLTSLNPNMPMLWSPFVNPTALSAEETYAFWRDVIKEGDFRAGDIICPMDSVNNFHVTYDGKTGCEIKGMDEYDKSYRRAVDDSGKSVKFWVNCESFENGTMVPASWARYVRQMQIASKYSEKTVTFDYAFYQSPYNADQAISNTYLDYLKNGKLETEPPTQPSGFKMTMDQNTAEFHWNASTDNMGIAGYYLYRDGKLIKNIRTKQFYSASTESSDPNIKNIVKMAGKTTYELLAYDYAGNYSEKASIEVTSQELGM